MPVDTFDDLLADHSPEVAALAARLRALIVDAHPEFTERLYRGWHGLGFHHPIAGYVAGLFPREQEVNVGFEHGAELPDPHRLFQGAGRRLRYLRFTADAGPTDDQLIEYLDLAVGA